VDGKCLLSLTDPIMGELGLRIGHRAQLISFIADVKMKKQSPSAFIVKNQQKFDRFFTRPIATEDHNSKPESMLSFIEHFLEIRGMRCLRPGQQFFGKLVLLFLMNTKDPKAARHCCWKTPFDMFVATCKKISKKRYGSVYFIGLSKYLN
jgi:hypothetical protein